MHYSIRSDVGSVIGIFQFLRLDSLEEMSRMRIYSDLFEMLANSDSVFQAFVWLISNIAYFARFEIVVQI